MICQACLREAKINPNKRVNIATQKHHKFPKGTKKGWRYKLYGDLLHDPRNLEDACAACNVSHAGSFLTHWSEKEFCDALDITPRSKLSHKIL